MDQWEGALRLIGDLYGQIIVRDFEIEQLQLALKQKPSGVTPLYEDDEKKRKKEKDA